MEFCSSPNKTNYDWISLFQSYKKYVSKNSTVLEIGASNIERTRALGLCCHKLIGVELFPERTPHDFNNIKYISGDWQELSKLIPPKSIDVAVISHVIEHVPNDLKAINELYTVLKRGGIALLNTPNRKRLVRTIIETFAPERKFPFKEHQREYTNDDLLNLLEASNFQKFKIIPIVFGIHGGPIYLYSKSVPKYFKKLANFWEIHLFKK